VISGKAWLKVAMNPFEAAPPFLIPGSPSRESGILFVLSPKWIRESDFQATSLLSPLHPLLWRVMGSLSKF
jgi:hypothetical protein